MRKLLVTVVAAVSVCTLASAPASAQDGTLAKTDSGLVRGAIAGRVTAFAGIPYAAPPVGPLRWHAPEPPRPWPGVRDARMPGARCAQDANPVGRTPASDAEDCLYLNVTVPRAHRGPLPVVVWVHGGSFDSGAGSDYGAARMAAEGQVAVVTVNYRLGIFGFFGYPGLPGSGTFSLQDQQAALRWVRANIDAFGGDPHRITLAGESAGALSTCAQLTSPSAAGLFDQAIMQSGACLTYFPDNAIYPGVPGYSPYADVREVEADGVKHAPMPAHCPDPADKLSCLRTASVGDLLARGKFFVRPAYGTATLPTEPGKALREGRFHRAPTLIGTTTDEMTAFVSTLQATQPIDAEGYRALLARTFTPEKLPEVTRRYPLSSFATPAAAWAALNTDRAMNCPAATARRLIGRSAPVFQFEFADHSAPNPGYLQPPGLALGASHASELGYLFDWGGTTEQLSAPQRHLASTMIGYWTRFARTGNPSGDGLPYWSRIGAQSLAPGTGGVHTVDTAAEHQCAFWDRESASPDQRASLCSK